MSQSLTINRQFVLASRPKGEPDADTLRLETSPVPNPAPGQMLLRTEYLSLDPYMRGRMSDAPSYAAPVALGAVMEGGTVAQVVVSHLDGFILGAVVLAQWPTTSTWVLGFLIGLNFLSTGISMLLMSRSAGKLAL